jgi:LPS export ABC transporter protein LptC/lipopolysaccharide transport protein LptA
VRAPTVIAGKGTVASNEKTACCPASGVIIHALEDHNMGSEQALQRNRFQTIGRVASLSVIILTVAVIVVAFVRTRRQSRPPGPLRSAVGLKADVVSIVEGYHTVRTEDGRETLRLKAARDIAYSDGHHELEEIDLTSFGVPITGREPKNTRIVAKRGSYRQAEGLVTFEGSVKVTSSDGLMIETESLRYEQQQRVASTETAVNFRQDEVEGYSIGARLSVETRQLELLKDVTIVTRRGAPESPARGESLPVTIRSQTASYDEIAGRMLFKGQATVSQGDRTATADSVNGWLDQRGQPADRGLRKIELRGGCRLTSPAVSPGVSPGASEVVAAEIDFLFDENEQLERSISRGNVRAATIDSAGLPRSIVAPLIEVDYQVVGNRSLARQLTAQGRATARFDSRESGKETTEITERVVEADTIVARYREDGESFARIDARGRGLLTVTPRRITPLAERKSLSGDQFVLHFAETGNRILRFEATGQVVGEFQPLHSGSRRPKRTLAGRRLDALFDEQTQDLTVTTMEGAVRFTEADRIATGASAHWAAASRLVTLRGRPQIWDSTARADAEEIEIRLESNESELRGKVRTTWFSQDSTGGATPFRRRQSPVTVVSDRATIKHPERRPEAVAQPGDRPSSGPSGGGGQARYTGNVRAWQDSDYIRADRLDLDRGRRTLHATGNAQSAYYQLEREIEKGRKQAIPVFASADQIRYDDGSRRTFYDGTVRIRQGSDSIEAATAEALMDEEHRLLEMVAVGQIVLIQPERIARGERLVYNFKSDEATLAGNPATVEDRQQQVLTSSNRLSLNSRDGRFEAGDDRVGRSRVRTTHRIK